MRRRLLPQQQQNQVKWQFRLFQSITETTSPDPTDLASIPNYFHSANLAGVNKYHQYRQRSRAKPATYRPLSFNAGNSYARSYSARTPLALKPVATLTDLPEAYE
jgi:hypothetical protein